MRSALRRVGRAACSFGWFVAPTNAPLCHRHPTCPASRVVGAAPLRHLHRAAPLDVSGLPFHVPPPRPPSFLRPRWAYAPTRCMYPAGARPGLPLPPTPTAPSCACLPPPPLPVLPPLRPPWRPAAAYAPAPASSPGPVSPRATRALIARRRRSSPHHASSSAHLAARALRVDSLYSRSIAVTTQVTTALCAYHHRPWPCDGRLELLLPPLV